ncbi:MAG TPA: GPR1/FUN34/YaaH family transporter [Candidatus Ozemobacteraceae bacterium]|nr:GPR1/FUN34/YaaH family transporter [Candidatus Ozemobacteraceae bacterium]
MIRKVSLGNPHHEVFGNPAPLGLLGLAVACAALTPVAFGYGITADGKLIPGAFATSGLFALLFGAGCQLLAGLMDFANRNTYGGTIFTAFAFNWIVTGLSFIGIAYGVVLDHTVLLATEILLLVVFLFLTYGFGFFSRLLFFFLLDIDFLYVFRIIRGFTGSTAMNIPIAVCTLILGLIGLWLALGGLLNPLTGRQMFYIGGPMFRGQRRKGFDWTVRNRIFEVLYRHWKTAAFAEMTLEKLQAEVKQLGSAKVKAGLETEEIVPDLFYLMEYGALKMSFTGGESGSITGIRLTAQGIDLYEQLILHKYEF